MSERIDAHLDGELPSDDLTPEERAQIAAFDAQVSELRAALTERTPADMDARVMRRISALGLEPLPARGGAVRRFARTLWSAHELRVRWRPAYPLAAAALIAALLLIPRDGAIAPDVRGPDSLVAAPGSAPIYVQFRLHTTDARDVALAASFTDWKPTYELQQVSDGLWTVLLPVEPGVHDYAFVIDGEEWVPDPYAPQVDDGFGGTNSRLTLLAPNGT